MELTHDPVKKRFCLADWFIASLIFSFSFLVYLATLTPSLSSLSPDGSELATVPAILSLAHMPGYPLYTWLGYLFSKIPIHDVAYRMNLMSAFFAAISAGGLYRIIITIKPNSLDSPSIKKFFYRGFSALAALLFAFSKDIWSQAVIAEVYAPNIGVMVITILALLNWEAKKRPSDYFLFALLFGLSLGTHLSNLGFAPAFIVFTLLTDCSVLKNLRWWLAAAGGFVLGLVQFIWLPIKAASINDRLMLRSTPTTLQGIYKYTLGSFSNLKFAFPIGMLPERLVLYLYMLFQQFGWLGFFLGIVGLFSLLFRRPQHFFLFVLMYGVHIVFFIQYRAFDLEVFFIPAHLLWAIFIAFGLYEIYLFFRSILQSLSGKKLGKEHRTKNTFARIFSTFIILLIIGLPTIVQVNNNRTENDHSEDTAINDFYANVWDILPENTVLLTQGGVFGYDAFYWQLIYNIRPDVTLPTMNNPNPKQNILKGKTIYSTISSTGSKGPGALPPQLLNQSNWYTPVLLGESSENQFQPRGRLVLYRVSETTPILTTDNANPEYKTEVNLGNFTLIGFDIYPEAVESGATINLHFYWEVNNGHVLSIPLVSLMVGDNLISSYIIGMGHLERYEKEIGIKAGDIIQDQFNLVIPSTLEQRKYPLELKVIIPGLGEKSISLGEIEITDQIGMVARWLQQTAGN